MKITFKVILFCLAISSIVFFDLSIMAASPSSTEMDSNSKEFIAVINDPAEQQIILDIKSRSFLGGIDEQELEVQSELFKPSRSAKIYDSENSDKPEQEEEF